uniref:major capsid protein n=1 Tax=Candidatus Electrothrix sp. TaxID=2170559 RepID=UPI004055A905
QGFSTDLADYKYHTNGTPDSMTNAKAFFDNNSVDLSSATTFDIADLRLAFQIQRWLERNARAGARYTEFLKSHFNVSPRDERLQRPEYIGGSKQIISISEVLQTSETTTTPQGTMAGHGLSVSGKYIGKYRAEEFGLIMGIMSIMPRSAYSQGIDRQWLRKTKYDFPFPEFTNLSEQGIEQAEIFATGVESENQTLFGYIGRYDECRVKRNMLAGQMRPDGTYDFWTLGRDFASAPLLNQSFIECIPSKRVFAVQDEDVCIVQVANLIKAVRPLPLVAEPGLIDHV